jgi:hypothetical protein
MSSAGLAGWTPIRFDFSGPVPAVEWADLSAQRFTEPFFHQTVTRWASGPHARPLVRTGLDELAALDGEDSMNPSGMIFHSSRCGSTLVSRLLGTLPGVVVISEPTCLNELLSVNGVDDAAVVTAVRLLVRALGRRRHGDERQLVLKCSSWNVRRRAILAAAFPESPWVWVQRDPACVLASLLANPPGWLGTSARSAVARMFGVDVSASLAMTQEEFAARALGAMLEAAATDPAGCLCIDYTELPAAVWERVAPHFTLDINAEAVRRMTAEARFYSKDPKPRVFAGDDPERRPLTAESCEAAEHFAEPAYRALEARKRSSPA